MRQQPVSEAAPAQPAVTAGEVAGGDGASDEPVIEDDLLVADDLVVEEISIDGMCGVY